MEKYKALRLTSLKIYSAPFSDARGDLMIIVDVLTFRIVKLGAGETQNLHVLRPISMLSGFACM
jgi:hypothetical protein